MKKDNQISTTFITKSPNSNYSYFISGVLYTGDGYETRKQATEACEEKLIKLTNIYIELHLQDVKDFFVDRPSISKKSFCREAKVSRELLTKMLADETDLTEKTAKKLIPIMEKYGWRP